MSYGSSPSTTAGQPQCLPFFGIIDNTIHAFRLVLAAKNGLVPRIVRRLTQSERTRMIISGAVFVFSVKESGMKRWRDGLFWSASRIDGNFLVYKEMNHTGGGRPIRDERLSAHQIKPKSLREGLKAEGLHKMTITVKLDFCDYHIISYYTPDDLHSGRLNRLPDRPDIMSLDIPVHLFRFADYRVQPKIEMGRIVCEPEAANGSICDTFSQVLQQPDFFARVALPPSFPVQVPWDISASSAGISSYDTENTRASDSALYHHPRPVHWSSYPPPGRQVDRYSRRPCLTRASAESPNSQPWLPIDPHRQAAFSLPTPMYTYQPLEAPGPHSPSGDPPRLAAYSVPILAHTYQPLEAPYSHSPHAYMEDGSYTYGSPSQNSCFSDHSTPLSSNGDEDYDYQSSGSPYNSPNSPLSAPRTSSAGAVALRDQINTPWLPADTGANALHHPNFFAYSSDGQ